MSTAARALAIKAVDGVGATPTSSQESIMPIVNIQITRAGSTPDRDAATPEEKARLIKGVSQLLLDVLNKPLDSTFVVIDEVALEDWGRGGLPLQEFRQQNPTNK